MFFRACQYSSVALAALLGVAAPALGHKVECTASAGVPTAATPGASTGSTAPRAYEVEVATATGARPTVVVTVRTRPSSSAASQDGNVGVTKVLLRSAYKSEAIAQPASFAAGSAGGEAVATFEDAAVRALPPGDVNVILFTPDGERLCQIRKKDRGTLLKDAK